MLEDKMFLLSNERKALAFNELTQLFIQHWLCTEDDSNARDAVLCKNGRREGWKRAGFAGQRPKSRRLGQQKETASKTHHGLERAALMKEPDLGMIKHALVTTALCCKS